MILYVSRLSQSRVVHAEVTIAGMLKAAVELFLHLLLLLERTLAYCVDALAPDFFDFLLYGAFVGGFEVVGVHVEDVYVLYIDNLIIPFVT